MAGGTLSGTLISLVVALTNTTMFSDLLSWQRSLREGSWLIITSNYVVYRNFSVASPAIARIQAMIQKRMTIVGSSQPFCSK